VSERRFLGLGVELRVDTPAGPVLAVLPAGDAAAFPPGRTVLLQADPAACRLLADG